ncbi:MAG: RNA 3'-terminal phosphate cyclase [Phycisphaerae bacterium]|jgi:RNA 3'-terminal phosphate cyclase (ATP)
MLTIDGSQGEGGGQILRTSLALSLVGNRPVRIVNVRAGRKKPGLLRQHLTAVEAATAVGRAEVTGASLGSQVLTFTPRSTTPGEYQFAVGTAGSTTLVLQTVLPALMIADAPSTLTLQGGTHNPFAPPFEFLEHTFLPLLRQMGPRLEARLERHGFYPAGGGKISVRIHPTKTLRGFDLLERGDVTRVHARVLLSKLPRHIADRELKVIDSKLELPADCLTIEEIDTSPGPGNVVLIEVESTRLTEVFASFGQRRVKAETVAGQAVKQVEAYMAAGVPVSEHLADQLLLPFAIAERGSYKTTDLSMHALTNINVIRQFLPDVDIQTERVHESAWRVTVRE